MTTVLLQCCLSRPPLCPLDLSSFDALACSTWVSVCEWYARRRGALRLAYSSIKGQLMLFANFPRLRTRLNIFVIYKYDGLDKKEIKNSAAEASKLGPIQEGRGQRPPTVRLARRPPPRPPSQKTMILYYHFTKYNEQQARFVSGGRLSDGERSARALPSPEDLPLPSRKGTAPTSTRK